MFQLNHLVDRSNPVLMLGQLGRHLVGISSPVMHHLPCLHLSPMFPTPSPPLLYPLSLPFAPPPLLEPLLHLLGTPARVLAPPKPLVHFVSCSLSMGESGEGVVGARSGRDVIALHKVGPGAGRYPILPATSSSVFDTLVFSSYVASGDVARTICQATSFSTLGTSRLSR